jgi:superfamily II DNA or RNA helicase
MNLNDYKKLVKVKDYDIREHQKEFLTNNEFDNSRKPFVLGAGTSSGKGPMSIMWLELFYSNTANKNKTTLFVSASKTILRDNIHEVLKKFKPSFSYSIVKDKKTLIAALERNAQVLVLIPQTIKSYYKLLPKIHTFILDEAHEWYFAKTIAGKESSLTKIIKHTQPTKQLLLTGTPSKFIANGDKFNFQFVPVMDLYDAGLVSNVKMEIVSSTYDFKANDWKGTYGNLKGNKTNSPKQAEDALVAVCKEMIDKLKNPLKDWYSINNVTKNSIGKLFDYMDKTIIYTHSLSQANKFHKILNSKKELTNKVLVSHSENDPDSIEFNKFKTEHKYKVLIAVDRGRIGFDMPELFNIVDFTMTQNLDMLLQMYGRLLRKSDLQKKKQKIYFKVATKNTADYFVDLMTAMLCLTHMDWYSMYNGKNMGGIQIPKVLTKSIRNKQYTNNQSKNKSNKVKPYVSLTELGIPLDLNFFRQSILHTSNSKFNTIAETTLDDVRCEMFETYLRPKHWTYDKVKQAIDSIQYKDEIRSIPGLIQSINRYQLREYADKKLTSRKIKWTQETLFEEFKNYNSRNECLKKSPGANQAAKRLGIYEKLCDVLGWPKRKSAVTNKDWAKKTLKPIKCFSFPDMKYIKTYISIREAERDLDKPCIKRVLSGEYKHSKNYYFEYA